MLESAEVGHSISKTAYAQQEPRLREALVNAQYDLSQSKRGPVLLIISGVEGGGRSETANKLTEWMDPRYIRVMAFGPRSCEEIVRPREWRYWGGLPAKGRIGIFLNAWYTEIIAARLAGKLNEAAFELALQDTRAFERMLFDEGFVLLKFWIHLSKNGLRDRLRELKKIDNGSRKSIFKSDYRGTRAYEERRPLWEEMLRETSTAEAPWTIVEGEDERYRHLTVGKVLLDALTHASTKRTPRPHAPAVTPAVVDNVRLIRDLDLSQKLSRAQYDVQVAKWQTRLAALTRRKQFRDHSLILAFEGADAAGKGSTIRRVTHALDARQYVTVPISAPTSEELLYPYLWRFWRSVPPHGGITIFDRTWYGRVLVERVEGFCSEFDWRRAYEEINQFEEQLVQGGTIVCKFWLQVSKAEQLKRFKAREKTPFKRFKITPDDWHNRSKWAAYEQAVADMVERTSTELAPWSLVEADDKYFARVKVLKTIVRRLEAALG